MLDPARPSFSRTSRPTRTELRMARESQRKNRRSRIFRLTVLASAVVVVAALVVGFMRASAPPAVASVHATMADSQVVPGSDPQLPWPAGAQAAVAIPAIGYAAQSGPERAVPVASMTKVMTAYIVLHDHPLAPGKNGPDITITSGDAADYATDTVTDQASVLVQAGEVLTERQVLEGMLVHSANNLAYTLACWDAGSLPAFVAKMNSTAASLGMTQTHYADASGYTPQSMSTPADLLKVASAAMSIPAFAQTVTMPSVTLPLAGTVSSYTPLLPGGTDGTSGVVGVKSGFTTAAGGGDILAYQSSVDGHDMVVLAAVTSMQGPTVLDAAGRADLAVAQAAASQVVSVPVVSTGERVATVSVPGTTVPVVTTTAGSLLAWPGQQVRQTMVVTHHPKAGARAGAPVGTALFSLGQQQVAVPTRTAARLPARTLAQRLF
jgi:serine-type D-Ala-D-Ala carboxypeptidase (penicillin-binding protein 5/6)